MKIDNNGKPQYGPRPRGPKPSGPDADVVFWVCVAILVIIVLGRAL